MTLLSDLFDPGDRPRALSAWASANSAGQVCGPPLGGVLAAAFGWRSIFIPTVILAALSCALAFRYLPRDREHAVAPLDWSAAITLTVGVILLLGALAAIPQLGPTAPAVLAAFALGLVSIALFVRAIRRAAHPFVSPDAFRDFDYRTSCTSVFAATVALGASLLAIPLYLIQSLGLSVALAGFIVLALPLAMAIVAPFSSGLVLRFGTRGAMALTSAALALSGAVLVGCVALRLGPLALLPAMILMGAAAAASYTAAAVATTQSAVGRIGAGLGLFNLLRIAGASVGAALVAIVLRYDANGYPTVFALTCAVAIAALVTGDPLARRALAGQHSSQ
jgi:MFS family permease